MTITFALKSDFCNTDFKSCILFNYTPNTIQNQEELSFFKGDNKKVTTSSLTPFFRMYIFRKEFLKALAKDYNSCYTVDN